MSTLHFDFMFTVSGNDFLKATAILHVNGIPLLRLPGKVEYRNDNGMPYWKTDSMTLPKREGQTYASRKYFWQLLPMGGYTELHDAIQERFLDSYEEWLDSNGNINGYRKLENDAPFVPTSFVNPDRDPMGWRRRRVRTNQAPKPVPQQAPQPQQPRQNVMPESQPKPTFQAQPEKTAPAPLKPMCGDLPPEWFVEFNRTSNKYLYRNRVTGLWSFAHPITKRHIDQEPLQMGGEDVPVSGGTQTQTPAPTQPEEPEEEPEDMLQGYELSTEFKTWDKT